MITSHQILTKANIPHNEQNLRTITNLVKRYKHFGHNTSETQICNYIIANYNAEKPNLKAIFSTLHNMKLSPIKKTQKIGRNDACPCGSKKKFKKCCM